MKYKEIAHLSEVFAPRETNEYEGKFIVIRNSEEGPVISLLKSENFCEFKSEEEAYEHIETRFEELTKDKEILEPNGIVLEGYLQKLSNRIARESRRGLENTIYKNFIFYDGNHIKADTMIGIWNVDGAYRVYENPNAEKYIQRMKSDLQNY